MKTAIKSTISLFLAFVFIICLASCNKSEQKDIWADAIYHLDTELGSGSKTVTVEVKAEDKSVTFTLHTDCGTVGEALIEHNLIAGEDGPYGLYIKTVNGIFADYDVNKSYWLFYINGEYAMSGVDTTQISEGTTYKLEYVKE